MTIPDRHDPFQMDYFLQSLNNGVYDVAEKQVDKHAKFIKQTVREHPFSMWTQSYLAKIILKDENTTLRYKGLIINILELKYGVGTRKS